MSLPAQRVLVIGGGFTGMSVAIALRKLGAAVDLVEIDPNWRTDGAGITVSGPSLRAIDALGLMPQFLQHGGLHHGFRAFDAAGNLIKEIPTPPVPGSKVSGGGGIMRPAFAKSIAEVTRAAGVAVRLGTTYGEIVDGADSVRVGFSDGTHAEYDLVIGADGVHSGLRARIFPEAPKPNYTGQGVWRAVLPRFGLDTASQFLGRRGKVGFTPVSDDTMYLYFTEGRPTRDRMDDAQLLPHLKGLLAEYSAPIVVRAREHLDDTCQILYRPLEGMLLPRPWYKGRVLLIGDAVHATTPHLASGAGMGHEDAVVLGEEFARGGPLQAVLERHQNRRWERCRMVVTHSGRLGEIEMAGGPFEEHAQIMALSMSALLAPI